MKYNFSLLCLIFLVPTLFCTNPGIESREKSECQIQLIETSEPAQQELTHPGEKARDYVPGEILIRFTDDTDQQTIETIKMELHLKTVRIVSRPNLYLMKILDDSSVEEIMERLQDFQEVTYSEPNYRRRAD